VRKLNVHPESAPGKFYIDTDVCTCSAACEIEAPKNIKIDDVELTAYVFKQPENADELEALKNAIWVCPVEAVVDDGDST
jgi:ferredoxin